MRTARAGIEGPTGPGPPRSRLIVPVIALAAAFSLAIGWYELLGMGEWHQYLEYDDGVWFGTAVRLAHGVLPYRSFVDDQPPGVPVLMLPFALWSRSVGTRTAFAWARLAVPLVETVGVLALGWAVRHRGALTTAIACGVMAVYPLCLIDQRTVMLEPFCAMFCLLGLAAAFQGNHLSGRTGWRWRAPASVWPALVRRSHCSPSSWSWWPCWRRRPVAASCPSSAARR